MLEGAPAASGFDNEAIIKLAAANPGKLLFHGIQIDKLPADESTLLATRSGINVEAAVRKGGTLLSRRSDFAPAK